MEIASTHKTWGAKLTAKREHSLAVAATRSQRRGKIPYPRTEAQHAKRKARGARQTSPDSLMRCEQMLAKVHNGTLRQKTRQSTCKFCQE